MESTGIACGSKRAKKQTFLKSYMTKFPWVSPCTTKHAENPFYAHCLYCKSDFYIGSAGASDIKRHMKGAKHSKLEEMRNNQPRLGTFMENRQKSAAEREALEKKEREMKEKAAAEAKEKQLKEDTIRAEVMMVELLTELNLSMNAATTLTASFKKMFPDSVIAQRFQCSRTKTTAIVKDLALKHKELLHQRMKSGPFSLATDGSNDSNAKLYPIVVRTLNPETLAVEAEVVSLPVLEESATGENIFNLLDQLLVECDIKWENCVSFGCDNASVMTGIHRGVMSYIRKKNPNCVLSGCTLHLVHIAAEKAAHQLPYQPGDLLTDIYYYMKKSSVRQRNLHKWQEYYNKEQRNVLKHVSTRWLSISRCIDRLVDDWRPLRSFFEEECKNTKAGTAANAKAKAIYATLSSETAKACALFLKYAVKVFDPFLTSNQSDAPKIHLLQESMSRLMMDVLSKFVKPTACCFKSAFEIEYDLPYNIKDLNEVSIGSETEKYMKNKGFSKQKKSDFMKSVIAYYKSVCSYMKGNLPHDSNFLRNISAAKPEKLIQSGSMAQLKAIISDQPAFIPAGATADTIESELIRLQQIIAENKLPEADRLDQRWALQAKQDPATRFACLFLLNLLVVPHSSASCERVFSYVRKIKTDQRARMGDSLLEALVICKHIPGSPLDRQHTPEMLKYLKGSCMRAVGKEVIEEDSDN